MFSQENYLKALNFAASYHAEQKTPKGLPYVTHLSSVAMEIIHAIDASKIEVEKADLAITVALLHDVLEDTDCTYDRLFAKFGENIANGVDALTKDETLTTKKEQMQDSIERILMQPYEIQMIKLADRIINLQSPPASWDNEKIKAYKKESKFILSCLRNANIYLSKRLEDKIEEYEQYIK